MIHRRLHLLLHLVIACLALPLFVSAQNKAVDRSNRLREHEDRIKAIIEKRREEAKKREEMLRDQQEELDQMKEEAIDAGYEDTQTAVSSVVMGFKFLNEEGVSDYNTIVEEGDTFLTEVNLFNIDKNPIHRIRLALEYDKRFVSPIKIFDSDIREQVKGEPAFKIHEREAIIEYRANFKRPIVPEQVVLLRILWEARHPASFTGITFAFDELEEENSLHTAIYANNKNILGVKEDPADGVMSGGLMIVPKDGDEKILQGKGEELRDLYLGSVASDVPAGLIISAPSKQPRVGEEFTVDVRLNNPYGGLVDALDFYIKFDPTVLRVVDSDKFNYISRGVNINTGPFRDNFPWDMHKRNQVRNDRGMINYQMSLLNGSALPSKTMARIHFMPLAPTAQTAIGFVKGRPQDIARTSVRYFGYERLELDNDISKPIVTFPILPMTKEMAQQLRATKDRSETAKAEDLQVKDLKIVRD